MVELLSVTDIFSCISSQDHLFIEYSSSVHTVKRDILFWGRRQGDFSQELVKATMFWMLSSPEEVGDFFLDFVLDHISLWAGRLDPDQRISIF